MKAPASRQVTEAEQDLQRKWQKAAQDHIAERNENKKLNAEIVNLKRKLQEETQRNEDLQGNVGALTLFNRITREQQELLFTPDSPAIIKLKELAGLRLDSDNVLDV